MQKVGNKLSPNSDRYFTYPMVEYDEDLWADASKFLPLEYDLLYLKIENKKSIIRGWYTGYGWDGAKFEENDKVLCWKKANHHDEI